MFTSAASVHTMFKRKTSLETEWWRHNYKGIKAFRNKPEKNFAPDAAAVTRLAMLRHMGVTFDSRAGAFRYLSPPFSVDSSCELTEIPRFLRWRLVDGTLVPKCEVMRHPALFVATLFVVVITDSEPLLPVSTHRSIMHVYTFTSDSG